MLLRRIFKQGNSQVISIPGYALAELGLDVGDYFIMEVLGTKGIYLTPRTAVQQEAQRLSRRN
jgi:antitoxin component of MazEF toxin-antitoxin module